MLTRIAFTHDAPHYAFDISMEDIQTHIDGGSFFTADRYFDNKKECRCTINPKSIAYFYESH